VQPGHGWITPNWLAFPVYWDLEGLTGMGDGPTPLIQQTPGRGAQQGRSQTKEPGLEKDVGWVWVMLPHEQSRSHSLQSILGRDSPPQTPPTWQGAGSPCGSGHHHAGLGDLLGISAATAKTRLVPVPPGLGLVWLQVVVLVPICCDAFSQTSCWLLHLRWGGAWQCPAGTLHEMGRRLEEGMGTAEGKEAGEGASEST